MSSGEYAIDDGPPATAPRPPVNRTVALIALVAVLVLIVGTVLVFRQDTPPAAAPAEPSPSRAPTTLPPPDVIDETGIGQIRVGMSEADYIDLGGGPYEVNLIGSDAAHGCDQFQFQSDTPYTTWVWARDGRIETVAVNAELLTTSFGPVLGGPLDRADESLAAWTWDDAAPVPVARLVDGDRVLTVADTNSRGIIDYITVGTEAGEECQPDFDPSTYAMPPTEPSAPAIDGTSLLGVSLGMTIDEVRAAPGWTEMLRGETSCSYFTHDEQGGAYVSTVVVGLEAQRVVGGPAVGDTVAQARSIPGTTTIASDPSDDVTVVVMPDGRRLRLSSPPTLVVPDGLDVVVDVRAENPDDQLIEAITVGHTCYDAVN